MKCGELVIGQALPPCKLKEMTAVRGEVGTAAALTKIGKKKFMERWKSTILASQVMVLLMPEAQASIKIHKNAYLWTNPQTNELVEDGRLLLNKALKLMHPDVQANVYMEIVKIKLIKPVDYAFNLVK
jgi:hypothetical protein